MKKDGTITIKGKDITIDGSGKINIKAKGNITHEGSEDPAELRRGRGHGEAWLSAGQTRRKTRRDSTAW